MMRFWTYGDGYVVLRAPMDGLSYRPHMGRQLFHSTEAVWEMLAREEWLVCRHDALPMVDIPGSSPVWAQYMYFLFLLRTLYILCFKIYMYYKMTLVVPDVVLTRQRLGNDFDCP